MSSSSHTELIYGDDPPILVLRTAILRVVEGPSAGRSCSMSARRVSVGTGDNNDLQLDDGQVSREHLEVRVVDQGYLVRDLRSTNGTYFRGARIAEALVGIGAELRLGKSVLRVERGQERTGSIPGKQRFGSLVGNSPPMQELYGMLDAVAPSDITVLISGETGSGKELVAEEIHRHSPRRNHLFSVLDCAALSSQLVESELFGHERGAFTGAVRAHVGIFERAHGGTVFIDEIGELPLALQTRLLRVLDQRTVQRVGSAVPRKVDVRLVAATHRDLAKAVEEGRFRQDLYYRLAVVEIRVPPLRERKGDIPALAKHFLWQAGCADVDAVLNADLLSLLQSRSWPGNVRELRNMLERAAIFTDGVTPIEEEELPLPEPEPELGSPPAAPSRTPRDDDLALPERLFSGDYKSAKQELVMRFERDYFARLMAKHGDNISAMAREADVARDLVRRLLAKHGLRDGE